MGCRESTVEGVVMTDRFWSDRRVFITGHTGFKGAWLSLWLQSLGAKVAGYALPPPTSPSLYAVADVESGMTSIVGDIRDKEQLCVELNSFRPDIVFHLAAQPLVRESYENPILTYETNVMGTANLFEAVRKTDSVRSLVVVTTDKCYENREWSWSYRENDHLGGYDPYSSSKACTEILSSSYRRSFFNPDSYSQHNVAIATARAGNVIGGGDWAEDRLVPDIIKAFSTGQIVRLRNPGSVRPWQYVLEPLHGYLILARKLFEGGPLFGQAWNFGPDETSVYSVETLVSQLALIWGGSAKWELDAAEQPHEADLLKLDSGKARQMLGWKPKMDMQQTLESIVSWYKSYAANGDVQRACFEQIAAYEKLNPA